MDWAGDALRCAEMRRILTNILGFSEMLADPHLPLQTRREYVDIICTSGQSLSRNAEELRQRVLKAWDGP